MSTWTIPAIRKDGQSPVSPNGRNSVAAHPAGLSKRSTTCLAAGWRSSTSIRTCSPTPRSRSVSAPRGGGWPNTAIPAQGGLAGPSDPVTNP